MAKIVETPLMTQYLEMKRKHPDAILLFRVGDFYETFSEDAITASEILGITLTRRANGKATSVELAGFPHHALDTYLPRLVRAGKRVAICEQLEDPKLTKKLVKRGITELITPGVNTNDASIPASENNYLAGIHVGKSRIGVAFLDITTGEFSCASGDAAYISKLISAMRPKELLRMHGMRQWCDEHLTHRCASFELDDWVYNIDTASERLQRHFQTASLKGFGVDNLPEAVIAAGSLLHYLNITCHRSLGHITSLRRIEEDSFVRIDPFTLRSLEVTETMNREGRSLFDVLDLASTPMGKRMLRRWLTFPLVDPAQINRRHDAVECFVEDTSLRETAVASIEHIGDIERLAGKAASGRIQPREMLQLKEAIRGIDTLRKILTNSGKEPLETLAAGITPLAELADRIDRTIDPDPPALLAKGNVIAAGVNEELDSLRELLHNGKAALQRILDREIEQTGIPSLKIASNNVFGYYIEVRNTHRDKVPAEWIRKQTLVNAERYITPELKEYEEKISSASEMIAQKEEQIYTELLRVIQDNLPALTSNAVTTAVADTLLGFATAAVAYGYVRPVIDDSLSLSITDGRHPVIERGMAPGESYVANSVCLDCDTRQIMMITGPNMSGKSALLRQTALIVLMAQAGSFVPASAATVGVVDKIFTRVGASDNISLGESTFMVEMTEAASILNNMSPRSLILFDELGRGTSTYDGISIAWAIVENIHENGRCRPKTLFATHYHELNEMEKSFPRIANFNVSVKEIGGKVVFLRKLEPGGSEHSFGIHVAKIAGMPKSIVKRATEVLARLESAAPDAGGADKVSKATLGGLASSREGYQLSLFQLDDPLLSQIRDRILSLSIDNLTPLQALTTLHDLKSLLTGK